MKFSYRVLIVAVVLCSFIPAAGTAHAQAPTPTPVVLTASGGTLELPRSVSFGDVLIFAAVVLNILADQIQFTYELARQWFGKWNPSTQI